jgi:DNA-binding MarR family transcriptional regulator
MKKEIKLTQKQEQVLRRYNELLAKHDYQPVWVDTAYVDMTALNKIVGANWFDRTFEALVQQGLLEKIEQEKIVKEGFFTGKKYTDWYWKLTDLGLEYLGIDVPNKPVDESTEIVTPKEEQKVIEVIAQVGNGRPVDMEGIVKFSGYTENRVKQIISDLIKKGLVEEGLFNDLFIEQDFYLTTLGTKYLTGELDINDSLNKDDVLEAILEVENDKAYEQDDEVTLQVDDVYYNLKFYDTLDGSKTAVMPLLINTIRFLAQDGFIEILENTKDKLF